MKKNPDFIEELHEHNLIVRANDTGEITYRCRSCRRWYTEEQMVDDTCLYCNGGRE